MLKKIIPALLFFIALCIVLFAQDAMTILGDSGNVGIGTETPTAKLEVAGNIKAEVPIKYSDGQTVEVMRDIIEALCPVGTIQSFGGTAAPDGWLLCDGSPVSRSDYRELFSVIETNFGMGDGSSTFNVPDLRNRFVLGTNDSSEPGDTGGSHSQTLTRNQMPVHNHGGSVSGGNHAHSYYDIWWSGEAHARTTGDKAHAADNRTQTQTRNTTGTGTHTHTIANDGSGQPFDNRPAFVKLAFIIKY